MDKILIVEDDIHISGMLCDLLRQKGYAPTAAYSGTEALLLLDLMLRLMMSYPNKVFSKNNLYESIWSVGFWVMTTPSMYTSQSFVPSCTP